MALVLKIDREADVLVRFLHGLVNLHLAPPVARPERHSPAPAPQPLASSRPIPATSSAMSRTRST